MRTINFTDARSNLKEVLDTVVSDHAITLIKRRDAEDAVVMSVSDYNSLQETLYLFGNATNASRLQAAMAEADASLPPGARILGPAGFDAAAMGQPSLSIRKVAKKATTPEARAMAANKRRIMGTKVKKTGSATPASRKTSPKAKRKA